jgi:protein TonB
MALSFCLHGLALLPLMLVGTAGAPSDEPAIVIELLRAAPAPGNSVEAGIDLPSIEEPPSVESAEIAPTKVELPTPVEPPPIDMAEIAPTKVDLPAPDEPPPLDTAEVKPPTPPQEPPKEPAKPQAQPPAKPPPPVQAKAAPPRPAQKSAVTQTASPPDTGTDQMTQTAASAPPAIVLRHKANFRGTPRRAVYPPRAVELGQQGEGLIRVRLDPDGAAVEIVLWRSSGHELLDRSALAAARDWQFLPEMHNGRAVAAWVEIPFRFHLTIR